MKMKNAAMWMCVITLLFTGFISADQKFAIAPVCGMKVNVRTAENKGLVVEYKGKRYYFCMKGDMERFKRSPEKYVKPHQMEMMEGCKTEKKHELMMESYKKLFDLDKKIKASLKASEQRRLIDQFVKEAGKFLKLVEDMHTIKPITSAQSHVKRNLMLTLRDS